MSSTALSITDCISCLLVFFSGLARTIFWNVHNWAFYDVFAHLCVGAFSSGIGNLVLVCASLDRLIYIKNVLPKGHPPFCCKNVARKMIILSTFISMIVNLPYCFIYRIDNAGHIKTTIFFESLYYQVHNWVRFVVTGLFPAFFLIFSNGVMIKYIRKWTKCSVFIQAIKRDRTRFQVRLFEILINKHQL